VRKPDDAAAVLRDLHRHALAHAAEAIELVMGDELEVPAHALRRALVQGAVHSILLSHPPSDRSSDAAHSSLSMPGLTGQSSTHVIGGYWIARSSRAMTAKGNAYLNKNNGGVTPRRAPSP
jgi:hypothetical protein